MVEVLSHFQTDQYNELIEQINGEHEKSERLKRCIKKENDKIIVTQLANCKLNQNISLVIVKVFNDVFEIYNVYQNEVLPSDFNKLLKYEQCKFYLFELYITKSLQEKLTEFNCLLSICIRYDNVCVNRMVKYHNKGSVIEVLPVSEDVVDCTVDTFLLFSTDDNWIKIKLHSVVMDVSYHFHTFKDKAVDNLGRKLLQVNKCYSEYNVDELRRPLLLEYSFKCDIKREEFIRIFLQHSYHQLDMELFSELSTESCNVFTINFSTGHNKHTVVFSHENKMITIKCCIWDLYRLKQYFLRGFIKGVSINRSGYEELKEMVEKSGCNLSSSSAHQNYLNMRRMICNIFI